MSGWIAMHRGQEADLLQERHPGAFLLLCQTARRARWRREPCPITGLRFGQAMLGDWKSAGLDSEKAYRHAKSVLERAGLVTFKGANKGTVATLVSTGIFSIETDDKGEQTGDPTGSVKGERRGRPGATKNTDTQKQEGWEECPSPLPASPIIENLQATFPLAPISIGNSELAACQRVLDEMTAEDWEALRAWIKAPLQVIDRKSRWPRDRAEFLANAGNVLEKVREWWLKKGGRKWTHARSSSPALAKPEPPAPEPAGDGEGDDYDPVAAWEEINEKSPAKPSSLVKIGARPGTPTRHIG